MTESFESWKLRTQKPHPESEQDSRDPVSEAILEGIRYGNYLESQPELKQKMEEEDLAASDAHQKRWWGPDGEYARRAKAEQEKEASQEKARANSPEGSKALGDKVVEESKATPAQPSSPLPEYVPTYAKLTEAEKEAVLQGIKEIQEERGLVF